QRADRLATLEKAAIEVELEAEHRDGATYVHIWVRDSGEGFDVAGCAEGERALAGVRRSGRGIALVRRLCEDVEYTSPGNSVRARYRLAERLPDPRLPPPSRNRAAVTRSLPWGNARRWPSRRAWTMVEEPWP